MKKNLLILVVLLLVNVPAFAESVDTAWVRRYNNTVNSDDWGEAIAIDAFGNVYVTGMSLGSGTGYDYATVKYNSSGIELWVKRYNGPGNDYDRPDAIAIDDSNNVYVTGTSYGGGTNYDFATIKYHPNGDTAWVRRYNGPGNGGDWAFAIAVDGSSYVYVTGGSLGSGTGDDYTTIKYYPNGDTAWVRRYNGPANSGDRAYAIAVDDSSNVYVTGWSRGSGTYFDYATVKYDSSGNERWVKRYNRLGNSYEEASAITIDGYSNVFVTGYTFDSLTFHPYDYVTIKYYSNGDTAWIREYNGQGNGADEPRAIAVDNSGNVYVTGFCEGATSRDYATVKYDSIGNEIWVRTYNGPENKYDEAYDIAMDGSGNVYVTGVSGWWLNNIGDYTTIKYYPDGDTAWIKTYNGPGNGCDEAYAIAVDDTGNVYVTGYSYDSTTGEDYVTIMYVQNVGYVAIIDSAFVPQTDTVLAGESVRWTNNDTVPHTSTSDTKGVLWDSDSLSPGESFSFLFTSPGSYPYHCKFHPSLTGIIVVKSPSDVKDETGDKEKPTEFTLSQNYPNPFNQTTKIEFTLAKSGFVSLNIYDILGRKVRTLVSENLSSGYKSVFWDGKNDAGKEVASGIYFYQMRVGDYSEPKKMLLLK